MGVVPSLLRQWLSTAGLLALAWAAGGCGPNTPGLVPVTGKVTLTDGTVPQGEVLTVNFVPDRLGSGQPGKAASGKIAADGSFTLSTIDPNDGAFPGDYKVEVHAYRTYVGREPLVADKYEKSTTSDLTAKVEAGKTNHFEFKVEAK